MSGSGGMERPERAAAAPGAQPRANGCSGAAHGGLRNGYVRGLPAADTQVSAPGVSCRPGAAGSDAREEVDGRGRERGGRAAPGSEFGAGEAAPPCWTLSGPKAAGGPRGELGGCGGAPRKFGSRSPVVARSPVTAAGPLPMSGMPGHPGWPSRAAGFLWL